MIAIVCLDDKNGMSFNHRRQSRDVCLRTWVMEMTRGSRLWMSDYSAGQFSEKERKSGSAALFWRRPGKATMFLWKMMH